ncbi:MAG TPA: Gfo/Idh/MocA family oxidoreductase [Devosiaceae bacterium]|nr:Gfo/Idh/MocA family oxidoreductase [Devosiaceae bacterium]
MRLLIMGTGNMASQHATQFAAIEGVELVAGVDTDPVRLNAFCDDHNIPERFETLEAALRWGQFDACANVTPDRVHHCTSMALIAEGKHVFCEKPLATDHRKAAEMTEAAERAGVVNMVNLTYRNVPQLQKARELVLAGALGEVRHVEASYLQSWLVSRAWGDWRTEPRWLWRLSTEHGSNGVLGDVGVHILDFAVFGAATDVTRGFARLQTFPKAEGDAIGDYKLDANDSFTMSVEFANGALGVIHASRFATGYLNTLRLRIFGDKGAIELQHGLDGASLRACIGEDVEAPVWRDVQVEPVPTNYQRFVEAVRMGCNLEPTFRHAANLQKVLDLALLSNGERKEVMAV